VEVHGSLSEDEVVGILGGYFLKDTLSILAAKPLPATATSQHCDADVSHLPRIADELSSAGMHVVGWYHSHPRHPPLPSRRDLSTQASYQSFLGQTSIPFIGLILSPWWMGPTDNPPPLLPSSPATATTTIATSTSPLVAPLRLFWLKQGEDPVGLNYDRMADEITEEQVNGLRALMLTGLASTHPVNLQDTWTTSSQGLTTLSKADKLRKSLETRLPASLTQQQKYQILDQIFSTKMQQ
jgi:hypothetical protein